MAAPFQFTPLQRSVVVKAFGSERGVPEIEAAVGAFKKACASQMSRAEVAEQLRQITKSCAQLQRSIGALSKGNGHPADWLLDPVRECERCATGVLRYSFKGPLKPGRDNYTAKIQLVHTTAFYWEWVVGRKPGRGRGPFSRLIGKLLEYSGVDGAAVKNPDELVRDALPAVAKLTICGPDYPFAHMHEQNDLPLLRRAAESFFVGYLVTPSKPRNPSKPGSKTAGKMRRKI